MYPCITVKMFLSLLPAATRSEDLLFVIYSVDGASATQTTTRTDRQRSMQTTSKEATPTRKNPRKQRRRRLRQNCRRRQQSHQRRTVNGSTTTKTWKSALLRRQQQQGTKRTRRKPLLRTAPPRAVGSAPHARCAIPLSGPAAWPVPQSGRRSWALQRCLLLRPPGRCQWPPRRGPPSPAVGWTPTSSWRFWTSFPMRRRSSVWSASWRLSRGTGSSLGSAFTHSAGRYTVQYCVLHSTCVLK